MKSIEEIRDEFSRRGYNLLSTEYLGNKKPLTYEKDGYKYYGSYNCFSKSENPKKWGKSNPYSLENLDKYLKEKGATCKILSTEYDCGSIKLKCACGTEYKVTWNNLLQKEQFSCPECGRLRGSLTQRKDDKFLPLLGKYGVTLLEEYKGAKKHLWARTKEGYITKVQLYSLSRGTNIYDFIFDIENPYSFDNMKLWLKLNGNGLKMISTKYIGAKSRYIFECPCGKEFETNWQYVRSCHVTRCPKCTHKISGLELKVREWLEENNIDYITEKTFPDCLYKGLLRFDFYLPRFNKIIEADGQQHYIACTFGSKSEKEALASFEAAKERDSIKNSYCEEHKIPLLRVPYTAFRTNEYKQLLSTFIAKI